MDVETNDSGLSGNGSPAIPLKPSMKKYWIAILLAALLINENTVQWALAMVVGKLGIVAGFKDAFEYFGIGGYLFFTGVRFIPYLILGATLSSLASRRPRWIPPLFYGGMAGILAMIIWGSWVSLRPYYTDEHVSSTTALAFLFIPIYAVFSGSACALAALVLRTVATFLTKSR